MQRHVPLKVPTHTKGLVAGTCPRCIFLCLPATCPFKSCRLHLTMSLTQALFLIKGEIFPFKSLPSHIAPSPPLPFFPSKERSPRWRVMSAAGFYFSLPSTLVLQSTIYTSYQQHFHSSFKRRCKEQLRMCSARPCTSLDQHRCCVIEVKIFHTTFVLLLINSGYLFTLRD